MANAIIKRKELGKEGVMAACLQFLDLYHIWNRRMNSGTAKIVNEATGKVRMFRANKKGTADILATPRMPRLDREPILLWVECKSSGGKQRPGQKEFQEEVEFAGHSYLLVNDVDQLREWLKGHGVIR